MESKIYNIVLYVTIIAPVVAILAIIIQAILKPYRQQDDNWSKILGYFEGNGNLLHEGINVNVSHKLLRDSIYGVGEYGVDVLNFTVEAPLKIGSKSALNLYKKSFITFNFVKKFGAKRVKLRNPIFDVKFTIESRDEQFVRSLLTEELQSKLLALSKIFTLRLYADMGVVSFAVVKRKPKNKEQYDMILSTALMIFSQIKRLCPAQVGDVSVKQIDEGNQAKIVTDLMGSGFKAIIIILFGLVMFCILVMKILN